MESIVSYPERGSGGKNSYRGNCSPKLIEDLLRYWNAEEVGDYMCGSGTTADVAKELGIKSYCYDLNSGFDLLNNDISEKPQIIFFHPPYWDIIRYADNQYKANDVITKYGIDPRVNDLSRTQSWDNFMRELNYCIAKQYAALSKGGHLGVLVGDIKKRGKYYSMILEMMKPGTIEQVLIKAQHNVWSDSVSYSGKFIPIKHEYLLLLKKEDSLVFNIQYIKNISMDMRDFSIPTWRHLIASVIEDMGGTATLNDLYKSIEGHKRTKTNREWKAKIRQTLQINDLFIKVDNGIWKLAV